MQKVESPRDRRWNLVFFIITLVVLAADQLSKLWIRSYPGQQPIYEAGFFRIIHIRNTGAAFGLLQDQFLLLTITAFIGIILVLLFVFYFSRHYPSMDSRAGRLTLGLVLGGTMGNLMDRLRFGSVTDFISVGFWPVFNIADSAVMVGVILFAYFFLISSRDSDLARPSLSK